MLHFRRPELGHEAEASHHGSWEISQYALFSSVSLRYFSFDLPIVVILSTFLCSNCDIWFIELFWCLLKMSAAKFSTVLTLTFPLNSKHIYFFSPAFSFIMLLNQNIWLEHIFAFINMCLTDNNSLIHVCCKIKLETVQYSSFLQNIKTKKYVNVPQFAKNVECCIFGRTWLIHLHNHVEYIFNSTETQKRKMFFCLNKLHFTITWTSMYTCSI